MLSRMVNSTSSSRNLADQCPDDTLDWMFDVDTADAAMARAQPSGPRGGRGGAASRGATATAARTTVTEEEWAMPRARRSGLRRIASSLLLRRRRVSPLPCHTWLAPRPGT